MNSGKNKSKHSSSISRQPKLRNDYHSSDIKDSFLTFPQAAKLRIHDRIDHRDENGLFRLAEVKKTVGTCLKIRYRGETRRLDVWSDYFKELHRFAHPKSISERSAHRMRQSRKGDLIYAYFNNKWVPASIDRLDKRSGQVLVGYTDSFNNKIYRWIHLDNSDEAAPYGSKTISSRKRKRNQIELFDSNDDNDEGSVEIIDKPQPCKKQKVNEDKLKNLQKRLQKLQNDKINESKKLRYLQGRFDELSKENKSIGARLSAKEYQESIRNNELSTLQKQFDELTKENAEIRKKLSLFNGESEAVNRMDLQELDALDAKLQNVSNNVRQARERLLETKLYCIACLENPKNVVLQPCGHLSLCKQCEQQMTSKICPRCQLPFDRVVIINH